MVCIVSQNVRGLRNNNKCRETFLYYKEKADILCFQECHSEYKDENVWRNEFKGLCFFSHGTTNKRGVMIAVKNNIPINVIDIQTDDAGRYIILRFKLEEQLFVLVNLYAPNRDSPEFFSELFKKVAELSGKRIIVGGFQPHSG